MSKFTLDNIYELLKDESISVTTKRAFTHKKTKNKPVLMSLGRIWFNLLLPDDFKLIDEPVGKKYMDNLIQEVIKKYDAEEASDIISHIQNEAFKMTTINPKSFKIEAFIPDDEWEEKRKEFQKEADSLDDSQFLKRAERLTSELMKKLDDENLGIQDVMNSGTKGGVGDWQALMVSRGFVVDMEGKISRITEANNDGYDIESFYKGGAQARRNYYVKSTMTAKPGYLARRVVMSCAHLKLAETDCKTAKTIEVFADKEKASSLIGRYYIKGGKPTLITNIDQILNKKIKLRTPIFCKSKKGICETCYGNLSKQLETKNIGILAGGAVNMEAVNAMMKMRHKSSQVEVVDVDFDKITNESNIDVATLRKYIDVAKTRIFAKRNLTIIIDQKDYDDNTLVDLGNKYLVPGILEVEVTVGDITDYISLPYNFNVDLFKPDSIDTDKSIIRLNYKKGDKILSKGKYIKEMDPGLMDRLFEGGTKYITTPEILLDAMVNELPKTDSIHLELVVSNMFRSKKDPTVPGRLVGYKDCEIYGCKKTPFIDSWLSALAFENINKAIKTGLVEQKSASFTPIEKVVVENYYTDYME